MLAQEQAVAVMLLVHHEGGLCGTYTRDIAQTKQTSGYGTPKPGHPLKCIVEEV